MTLHQFRILVAIAKSGSLTKAALELRLSQPALSHQLRLLQEWYGAEIYLRTPAGVELTEAGRKLLADITPILAQVAQLKGGATGLSRRQASREALRVGAIESASADLLPAVLAQFHRRYPQVELRFRSQTSERLEAAVLAGALKVAVTGRASPVDALISEPLRAERMVLFVAATHPLAKEARVQIADLAHCPLIVRGGKGSAGIMDNVWRQLHGYGLRSKVGVQCDGPAAIKAAVREGAGVGIVFEDALKAELAAGDFKTIKIAGLDLGGESYIVHARERVLSPIEIEFVGLLRSAARPKRVLNLDVARRATVAGAIVPIAQLIEMISRVFDFV